MMKQKDSKQKKIDKLMAIAQGESIANAFAGAYWGVVIKLREDQGGAYGLINHITGKTERKTEEEFANLIPPEGLGFIVLPERNEVPE